MNCKLYSFAALQSYFLIYAQRSKTLNLPYVFQITDLLQVISLERSCGKQYAVTLVI
jgi:hypothetical protein